MAKKASPAAASSSLDWKTLKTAKGTATRVPALVQALVGGRTPNDRYQAHFTLNEGLRGDGVVSTSAAATVPLLCQVLASQKPDAHRAAWLVAEALTAGHERVFADPTGQGEGRGGRGARSRCCREGHAPRGPGGPGPARPSGKRVCRGVGAGTGRRVATGLAPATRCGDERLGHPEPAAGAGVAICRPGTGRRGSRGRAGDGHRHAIAPRSWRRRAGAPIAGLQGRAIDGREGHPLLAPEPV